VHIGVLMGLQQGLQVFQGAGEILGFDLARTCGVRVRRWKLSSMAQAPSVGTIAVTAIADSAIPRVSRA
jgi:hypothetical protein